jgi:hypothetical protein
MAFVKQLMNIKFEKTNMERHYESNFDGSSNEVCFLLAEQYYALTPFWRNVQKKTFDHYGGATCHAGVLCRLDNEEDDVGLQGEGINGFLCCKCQKPFHKFCLFQFEDNVYCSSCFKEHVSHSALWTLCLKNC